VHFIEIAETGNYSSSDHVHVEMWYSPVDPDLVAELAGNQMALARHGGKPQTRGGVANYGFLDGHAETSRFEQVYKDRQHNRFDPAAIPN
jgi:prepilin-type processing-associated H-X9-DG protein